jgi:hypothetical protein
VSEPKKRRIGTIDVGDLDILCRSVGRDGLPFPLMFPGPSRFASHDEQLVYARTLPDRVRDGDLAELAPALAAYLSADIRVECHTQRLPDDPASVRVVAFRKHKLGFLAVQRPDDDTVEVYALSPYDIGAAVAHQAGLLGPGEHDQIVVPEYVARQPPSTQPASTVSARQQLHRRGPAPVARTALRAFGTVQTHWRPTRRWGVDPGKDAIVWVGVDDDGDYLFNTALDAATPLTVEQLTRRTDESISADIAALQAFRAT